MRRASALDALALTGVRLLASALVWVSGFRAISDDDYARVTIAQRFAAAPRLDPSGTSWLPLPFWLQGGGMLLAGPSLETARAVALLSGVLGTLLVWTAGRWLGFDRLAAFTAAAIASLFPYSAWLGVAMVPESLTAGLAVLGAASLGTTGHRRVAGALALAAATLSRYECWPVAAAFAALSVWDALRKRQPLLGASAALALVGILLWLLNGAMQHGDATFFVKRVSDYQRALGEHRLAWLSALTRYPLMALRHEPELALLASAGALWAWGVRRTTLLVRLGRPLLTMLALLGFLVVGDLSGAGATHHAERALLPLWTSAALVIGATLPAAFEHARQRSRSTLLSAGAISLGALTLTAVVIRARVNDRSPFIDRSAELQLGRRARELVPGGRLLIVAQDYGFFAMMAAFGDPSRARPWDDEDPRHPRAGDPFAHPRAFDERLARDDVRALIAPTADVAEHAEELRLGVPRATAGPYALVTFPARDELTSAARH